MAVDQRTGIGERGYALLLDLGDGEHWAGRGTKESLGGQMWIGFLVIGGVLGGDSGSAEGKWRMRQKRHDGLTVDRS